MTKLYCSECGVDLATNQTMYCSPECRLRERMWEYGETEDEARQVFEEDSIYL